MTRKAPHPHERRFVRLAYVALVAAAGLAFALAATGEGKAFGAEMPALLAPALVLAGVALGAVGARRRSGGVALAACALLALALVPAGGPDAGLADYALGLLFGLALLAYGELVHMTARYDRAHAAVERENVPEDHLDRVADEALKTLATRGVLALGLAALGVLLAFLLASAGPLRLREAVETRAPLGVALASLALMGGIGLFILVRGARAPRQEPQESAPDAVE